MLTLYWYVFVMVSLNFSEQKDPHPFTRPPETGVQQVPAISDTSVFGRLPSELGKYYQYINLASRAIYRNDFELASALYDTAFMHKEYPFYVDLANYIRVNTQCKRWDKNETALYRMIKEKHIDTISLFTHLPVWIFDEENLKTIRKAARQGSTSKPYSSKVGKHLREVWVSDQEVREYDKIPSKSREEIKALYVRRDSVDSINVIRFKSLVHTYGFPDEETLGADYHDSLSWNTVLQVLLLHFLQREDAAKRLELVSIIRDAVRDGKWNTSLAASLLDRLNIITGEPMRPGQNFMYTSVYLVLDELYRPFVFYSDSLMRVTNLNRIAIGLDSFHVVQRQAVCQYLGSKGHKKGDIIVMQPWAEYIQSPPGLVKRSAEEANVDATSFKINTQKILDECRCEEKLLRRY